MKTNVLFGIASMLLLMFTVSSGWAQSTANPQALADNCIAKITEIADRAVAANTKTLDSALERIAKLLEDDKPRQARVVAHEAIENINRRSYVAVQSIDRHSDRCIHGLLRMGEPELAREVAKASREQTGLVGDSRESSVKAIREALPESRPSTES